MLSDPPPMISVVIRTLNEGKWLGAVLDALDAQTKVEHRFEVVVVDSGSSDATLTIAEGRGCRVVPISRADFSFGRALNLGCGVAHGDILVFLSGHCIPQAETWLTELTAPLVDGVCVYTYGRQIGHPELTKFSEHALFSQYFPGQSAIPQDGFFCNNANAAMRRDIWNSYRFDEALTGLEDMELAKRLANDGHKIGYVGTAEVMHIHEEPWGRVRTRYERESYALQQIMPEVHVGARDAIRYVARGILRDAREASDRGIFWHTLRDIVMFRTMQFWGVFRGNREHRELSRQRRDAYFYPQ